MSIVLLLGFVGGFTGKYIEEFLQSLQISTDFIKVSDDTRINIKIKSEVETEINAKGPKITKDNFIALKEQVKSLTNEDVLVLAGSIPSGYAENDI